MRTKRLTITTLGIAIAIAFSGNLFAQASADTSNTPAVQTKPFAPNATFDDTIRSAMRKTRTPFLTRVKVWLAMRNEEVRYEMELALTEKALEMGIVQPEGVDGAGVYGNPWTDFLDWVIANWDDILKIIMTIVDIFTDTQPADVGVYNWPADDVRYCSLAAPQCVNGSCATGSCATGTCVSGACTPPPSYSVLVARSSPRVDVMRSRTVTSWRRAYRPRRMLTWRRFR